MRRKILYISCIILSLTSIVYAQVKASEADKEFAAATAHMEEIQRNEYRALAASKRAEEAAAKAIMLQAQWHEMKDLLENCKTK